MSDPVLVFAAKKRPDQPRCLRLMFYDVIGGNGWGDGITAKRLQQTLDQAGELDEINVRVNSPGGITSEGFAIYNILRGHQARVTVDVDGDASSMASVVVQAGDERRMADNAEMLVHEARATLVGRYRAGDLASLEQRLATTNDRLVELYQRTTGQDAETLRKLLAAETTLTAQRAKELGFIDQVTTAGEREAAQAWEGVAALSLRSTAGNDVAKQEPAAAKAEPPAVPAQNVTLTVTVNGRETSTDRVGVEAKDAIDTTHQVQQQLPLVAALSNPITPPPTTVGRKGSSMQLLQILASSLGLGADADAAAVQAAVEKTIRERDQATTQRTALLQAVGVAAFDEALGAIAAGVSALEQNRALSARVTELEKNAEEGARAEVIARIKVDGKCTPAQEIGLFPTLSLEGLKQFEKTATRVIGKINVREPSRAQAPGTGAPTWDGKTWAQLTPLDRYNLGRENRELFDAMRDSAR